MSHNFVEITFDSIDAKQMANSFVDKNIGALVTFEGRVRNSNCNRAVTTLSYESYQKLCVTEGNTIIVEAINRFDLSTARCVHRLGDLPPGELAVWIGVAAQHRKNAFLACEFIIDEIKKRLPIWKKESYLDGSAKWLGTEKKQPNLALEDLQKQYYARQALCFNEAKDAQNKLQKLRVLVVGAGGLGTHCLTALAQTGVGTIGICEHDKIEITNLHRQPLYSFPDVGLDKLFVALQKLKAINPFITIHGYPVEVSSENIDVLANDYDVLVDCTDNFECKFLLNDFSLKTEKPLISASVYKLEGFLAGVYPARNSTCLRCLWPQISTNDNAFPKLLGIISTTPAIMGQLQALEVIKYALDLPGLLVNECLAVSLEDYIFRRVKLTASSQCQCVQKKIESKISLGVS